MDIIKQLLEEYEEEYERISMIEDDELYYLYYHNLIFNYHADLLSLKKIIGEKDFNDNMFQLYEEGDTLMSKEVFSCGFFTQSLASIDDDKYKGCMLLQHMTFNSDSFSLVNLVDCYLKIGNLKDRNDLIRRLENIGFNLNEEVYFATKRFIELENRFGKEEIREVFRSLNSFLYIDFINLYYGLNLVKNDEERIVVLKAFHTLIPEKDTLHLCLSCFSNMEKAKNFLEENYPHLVDQYKEQYGNFRVEIAYNDRYLLEDFSNLEVASLSEEEAMILRKERN